MGRITVKETHFEHHTFIQVLFKCRFKFNFICKQPESRRDIADKSAVTITKTILINHKINSNYSPMASQSGTRIISHKKLALTRIHNLVRTTQHGLCRHCQMRIEQQDKIVSRGRSRRFYYHKHCAKKLNIIWSASHMYASIVAKESMLIMNYPNFLRWCSSTL